jgi:hypothetical protein
MATGWVYVLGETTGADIKTGYTSGDTPGPRVKDVIDGWNGQRNYVTLAAVRGTLTDEKAMRRPFRVRTDLGNRKEYLWPDEDLLEYVNWLRSQWFISPDGNDAASDFPVQDPNLWLPAPSRRISRPEFDSLKLVQDYDIRNDHLAGTPWSWMVNPQSSFQDYFTPPDIIAAARQAMGGIDLDAASHWGANRVHQIPDYFHVNRSAFENPWHGRVWLNPPYGDNAPWFREIQRYVTSGAVEQVCMLSPMWAFITGIAQPIVDLSSALVLLSPTPRFWGNSEGRTGRNDPHGVLYMGKRRAQFLKAFREHGIALKIDSDPGAA